MALQLPDAASLERTDAAAKKIEEVLSQTPGVQYTTRVSGLACSDRPGHLQRLHLCDSQAVGRTQGPKNNTNASRCDLNKKTCRPNRWIAFAFPPPAIPGVGTSGGVSFPARGSFR